MTLKRIEITEISNALKQGRKIISKLHRYFKNDYKFIDRLVGSAKWNVVLKDKNGWYDVDFQLLLTRKSAKIKNYDSNIELKSEATMIKEDFFNFINERYNDRTKYAVENSTTSITFRNIKEKYSIDFVLIKFYPENNQIIRRSNNSNNPTVNYYVWNELSRNNEAYEKFNNLSAEDKEDLIENHILPRKMKEKQKDINDPTLKSSSVIFKEEVLNYVSKRKNN